MEKRSNDQIALLEAVAKERNAEANVAGPMYVPYVPQVGDTTAPHDLQEAADYYLTLVVSSQLHQINYFS